MVLILFQIGLALTGLVLTGLAGYQYPAWRHRPDRGLVAIAGTWLIGALLAVGATWWMALTVRAPLDQQYWLISS